MKNKLLSGAIAGSIVISLGGCATASEQAANSDETACTSVYEALNNLDVAHTSWLAAWALNSEDATQLAVDFSGAVTDFDKSVSTILPEASAELKSALTDLNKATSVAAGSALLNKSDSVALENWQASLEQIESICSAVGVEPTE